MMSTSRPIFVARPDSIADWIVQVLRVVDDVAVSREISYVLVGAKARELLEESVFGLASRGLSEDLDFGFAVKDWHEFAEFKSALIATDKFEPERELQRVSYRDAEGIQRLVDLIPFGGVADQNGRIEWPPYQDIVMTVAGFEEALSSAILVRVAEDLHIPFVSLSGLALLKLIAWTDRGDRTNKDALDLYRLLRNYGEAGNADRLYGKEISCLELENYDFDLAGARLLGKDVTEILTPATASTINALLRSDEKITSLFHKMLQEPTIFDENDQAKCENLLRAFRNGFLDQTKTLPKG